MNYLKRAFLSVERRKGKSLILLLVVFILGNVMAGAISVESGIKNTKNGILKSAGLVATVEKDWEKMVELTEEEYKKVKSLTVENVKKIGSSKYISYYDYTTSFGLTSKTLKRYVNENGGGGIIPRPFETEEVYDEYFTISGGNDKDIVDIRLNKIKLKDGRLFNEDEVKEIKNVVLISEKLAQKNNLKVGSKIKLLNTVTSTYWPEEYDPNYVPKVLGTQEFEFEVIGIFSVNRPKGKNVENDYMYDELENKMYTSNQIVESAIKYTYDQYKKEDPNYVDSYGTYSTIVPLYVIKNPLDLDKFKEEAEAVIPAYHKVTDNAEGFRKLAAPMENMQWLSGIILAVSIGSTIVILSLLITLFLRDRKHEIGIYMSLGEYKTKIISQIFVEIFAVAIIGITVSLFTGGILANSMSRKMLNNQLIADSKKDDNYVGGESSLDWLGYKIEINREDLMKSYKIKLNGEIIMLFYAVGVSTVLISSVLPMIYITRLKPKKVLM